MPYITKEEFEVLKHFCRFIFKLHFYKFPFSWVLSINASKWRSWERHWRKEITRNAMGQAASTSLYWWLSTVIPLRTLYTLFPYWARWVFVDMSLLQTYPMVLKETLHRDRYRIQFPVPRITTFVRLCIGSLSKIKAAHIKTFWIVARHDTAGISTFSKYFTMNKLSNDERLSILLLINPPRLAGSSPSIKYCNDP